MHPERSQAIEALLAALAARGPDADATDEVAALAVAVARRLGLGDAAQQEVRDVALLRHVGKLGLPDGLLAKRAALTEAERQQVCTHPTIAERMLADIPALADLAPTVGATFERWDGRGYPRGLGGDDIPLAAQIVHAADAYVAMTSDRPYRPAFSPGVAAQVLERNAGTQFAPAVVAATLAVLPETEASPAAAQERDAATALAAQQRARSEMAAERRSPGWLDLAYVLAALGGLGLALALVLPFPDVASRCSTDGAERVLCVLGRAWIPSVAVIVACVVAAVVATRWLLVIVPRHYRRWRTDEIGRSASAAISSGDLLALAASWGLTYDDANPSRTGVQAAAKPPSPMLRLRLRLRGGWTAAFAVAGVAAAAAVPTVLSTNERPRQLLGVQVHSLWGDRTSGDTTRELDLAKELGSTVVRLDVGWASLEPTRKGHLSRYEVQRLDAFMDKASDRGIKVIATLWATPCWASSAPESLKQGCRGDWWGRGGITRYAPEDPQDYADVARWLTDRYGSKLAALEVWNEPNFPGDEFWIAGSRQEEIASYARLVRATYPAAKAGDRDVPVLAGSLSTADRPWLDALYAQGIRGASDGISVHPYNEGRAPGDRWQSRWRQYTFLPGLEWIRQGMKKAGDDDPVWVTEVGWTTAPERSWQVSDDQQARYLASAVAIARSQLPWVRAVVLYELRDPRNDPQDFNSNFGIVTESFKRKPAFAAVRAAFTGAKAAAAPSRAGVAKRPATRKPDGTVPGAPPRRVLTVAARRVNGQLLVSGRATPAALVRVAGSCAATPQRTRSSRRAKVRVRASRRGRFRVVLRSRGRACVVQAAQRRPVARATTRL